MNIVGHIARYFAWQHLVYQANHLEFNSSADRQVRQSMKLTRYRCDVFATFGSCDQPSGIYQLGGWWPFSHRLKTGGGEGGCLKKLNLFNVSHFRLICVCCRLGQTQSLRALIAHWTLKVRPIRQSRVSHVHCSPIASVLCRLPSAVHDEANGNRIVLLLQPPLFLLPACCVGLILRVSLCTSGDVVSKTVVTSA